MSADGDKAASTALRPVGNGGKRVKGNRWGWRRQWGIDFRNDWIRPLTYFTSI